MKIHQEAPRLAKYVATTVATRIRGATTDLSSSTSATTTSTRTSGMITSRSRADPAASSISVAAVPPTYVASSPASASRRSRTVRSAVSLPGSAASTTSICARPPAPGPGGAEATPSTDSIVARTASGSSRVITTVGSEMPAGNDSASRSPALIASGLSRNWSASLSPVCTWVSPSASPPSTREQTTMEVPGRRSTTVPTRCHSDVESTKVGSPSRGTRGQKTQRPRARERRAARAGPRWPRPRCRRRRPGRARGSSGRPTATGSAARRPRSWSCEHRLAVRPARAHRVVPVLGGA